MELLIGLGILIPGIIVVTLGFNKLLSKRFSLSDVTYNVELATVKKLKIADLNDYRSVVFPVALFITLLFTVTMITWKSYNDLPEAIAAVKVNVEDEIIDIPQTDIPPPEPPKIKPTVVMEVVPDQQIVEEEEAPIEVDEDEYEEVEEVEEIEEVEEEVVEQIYMNVDNDAEFPSGGEMGFISYVSSRNGITEADLNGSKGGVILFEFIIDATGRVSNVVILQGLNPKVDQKIKQTILRSPKWKPGKVAGKSVKQKRVSQAIIQTD